MSFARQGDFPADIVGLAPVDWRIGARRHAVGRRPAPLWPVVRGCGAGSDVSLVGEGGENGETTEDEQKTRHHADALCTFDGRRVKGGGWKLPTSSSNVQ